MSEDTKTTEAAEVAAHAIAGAGPSELIPGTVYTAVTPQGYERETIDTEGFQLTPIRKRGTTELHEASALSEFIDRHKTTDSLVFADLEGHRLVAVFNEPHEDPEWADHRAGLSLRLSAEWEHWAKLDGKLVGQAEFAEHIEDGAEEIREPDAATMLELAQTFIAKVGVNFKASELLSSGQRQFTYEETVAARAGHTGKIDVPTEFVLGIPPFRGTDPYKVVARLRFRIGGDGLKIGYRLIRPHIVVETAFKEVCEAVHANTGVDVLMGKPVTGVRGVRD